MFAAMQLGRIARDVPADAPQLSRSMRATIAPPRLIRDHVDFRPACDGNDVLGDCTAVALANCIRAQAALCGFGVDITTDQVIAFYGASTGYSPAVAGSDQGGVEVDVLRHQAAHGFQAGAVASWVGDWGTIPPDDLNGVRLAASRLGGAYLGLSLALADQDGGVWDTDTPGDQTPGSWGGHAALLWSYSGTEDTDTVEIATWGMLQRATWRWVRSRLDEAHGVAHRQLIGPSGRNWAGVDWDTLAAECAGFNGGPS